MSICKIVRNILEPLSGFIQNIIFTEKHFAKLKESDVQKLSYRFLNMLNEINFTAIDISYLTAKQIQKIDLKHMGYLVRSGQVDAIVDSLTHKQMIYATERRYFPNFFKKLSLIQKLQVLEESTTNHCLERRLKKHFSEFPASEWIELWNGAQKYKMEKAETVLLKYFDIKKVQGQSPDNILTIINKIKDGENNLEGLFSDLIVKEAMDLWNKLDLQDPEQERMVKLFLNHICNSSIIEQIYDKHSTAIHTLLSKSSSDEMQGFIKHLSPDTVVYLLLSDDLKSYEKMMKKIMENQSKQSLNKISAQLEEELSNLDDAHLAFILPYCPLYNKLHHDKLKTMIIKYSLPSKIHELEFRQIAELLIQDSKVKGKDEFAYKLLNHLSPDDILEKLFPLLTDNVSKEFVIKYLNYTSDQWINIFVQDDSKNNILRWFLLDLEIVNVEDNYTLIQTFFKKIPKQKIIDLIQGDFLNFDLTRMTCFLKKDTPILLDLFLIVIEKGDLKNLDHILKRCIKEETIKKWLNDATISLEKRKLIFNYALSTNSIQLLEQVLKNLLDPIEILKVDEEMTNEQLEACCQNLEHDEKDELLNLIEKEATPLPKNLENLLNCLKK